MSGGRAPSYGLICEDDPVARRAIRAIMEGCGVEVVGEVKSALEAIRAAKLTRPDVIVLELALSGVEGLGIVTALMGATQGCAVIVLSPFASLRGPAVKLGAYELIDKSDLRRLDRCLQQLNGHEVAPADQRTDYNRHPIG